MSTAPAGSALAELQAVAREPAKVAETARAAGRKVIGYRCMYVPEEIIWAAGGLAYPLYGTPEPIKAADSYFQSCTCEFVRNIFDHALEGRLAFLDGLALANTCDVVRRLCDIWAHDIEGVPVHMINNPQKLCEEGNQAFWVEELRRFKAWVEARTGQEATDAKLAEAIALHNRTRSLLREVYSLRKADAPPISGPEALEVCLAASLLPKDQANPLLARLLEELQTREVEESFAPRILVTGSLIDDPALIRMIEEEGGLVVADDLCTTTRYFWHLVDEGADPLEALWRFENKRPLCACMHPTETRLAYLNELADEYDAEAVIYFNLKYCHPFLYEAPLYKKALAEREIPTNVLEVGHDHSGHGQLRTRIQAFIEMLEA